MTKTIIKGTLWSAIQRFGSLAISFISNMVLARLLCPEDFGAMGMVMVFVGIADTIVDGGLGNALIQKKNISETDIKTVFTSNLIFSIILFLVFFFSAPFFERFTEIENLSLFIKIESFQILFRALYVIPFSLMERDMNFSRLALINIVASLLSVVIAITMALLDYGIWSLIVKNLLLDIILLIFYIIFGKFNIKVGFSKNSFKQLFGFGLFVVLSNLIETLYTNLISFFIGKEYSVKELGYYNQAYTLQQIPTYSITAVLNQVLFPYFSRLQNDENQLTRKLRTSIQLITFFVFPLLLFLICYADQVIILLYSEKWLPCVPYFQTLCISGLLNAMIHLNRSMLKSKGCTKLIFNIQISSAIIGICLLLIGLNYSMIVAVSALAVNSIIMYILTVYFSGKECGYSILKQIIDILPSLIISLLSTVICYWILHWMNFHVVLELIYEAVLFFSLYILLHKILNTQVWNSIVLIIKSYKR